MIMIDYRMFNQSLIRLYKFNLIIIMIAQHEVWENFTISETDPKKATMC